MKYKISDAYLKINGSSIAVGAVLGEEDKPNSPRSTEIVTNEKYESGLKAFIYGTPVINDMVYHRVGEFVDFIAQAPIDPKWIWELMRQGYDTTKLNWKSSKEADNSTTEAIVKQREPLDIIEHHECEVLEKYNNNPKHEHCQIDIQKLSDGNWYWSKLNNSPSAMDEISICPYCGEILAKEKFPKQDNSELITFDKEDVMEFLSGFQFGKDILLSDCDRIGDRKKFSVKITPGMLKFWLEENQQFIEELTGWTIAD
jgi:hypothetical protein